MASFAFGAAVPFMTALSIADVDAEGSLPGARHALADLYAAGAP
jgi:hypothetical protein